MPSGRSKRVSLTENQKSLFVAGTRFVNDINGALRTPFVGMAVENGAVKKANGLERAYQDPRRISLPSWYKGGKIHTVKKNGQVLGRQTHGTWQTGSYKAGYAVQLKDLKEISLQLAIASHLSDVSMEHWKYVLALRAQKIFQNSFVIKRFDSQGSAKWKANTRFTYLKRMSNKNSFLKRGLGKTWPGAGKLMQETDALRKSIIVKKNGRGNQLVTTGPAADGRIYAGVHNNPKPGMTYGRILGAKPVVQRQFMGHSTRIDDFMLKYEIRYLFHMVFRVPKEFKIVKLTL